MKRMNTLTAVACALVLWPLGSLALQDAVEAFRASDVAKRREITRALAVAQPSEDLTEVSRLIAAAMRDSDEQVRFGGASVLHNRLMLSQGLPADGRARTSLSTAELSSALSLALEDQDFRIRGIAVQALVATGDATRDPLKATLARRFTAEGDPGVRALIIDRLTLRAKSVEEDLSPLILLGLTDPSPDVRRAAAMAAARRPTQQTVTIIAEELLTGDEAVRGEFIYALANHGRLARPYLYVLEQLLASTPEGQRRFQLEKAIGAIEQAK